MSHAAHHCRLSAIAFGVAMSFSSGAWAQDLVHPQLGAEERGAGAGRGGSDRSLSDAVRHVQRTTGGRILGAERVPFDGRDINRVKYMDDRGRVRYMDAPVSPRVDPGSAPRHGDHF